MERPEIDEREMQLMREAPAMGEALTGMIDREMPEEGNLRLEVTLIPGKTDSREESPRVGLRIGEKKWYVVKDISEFIRAWRDGTTLEFQSKFVFEPGIMRFRDRDKKILNILNRMVSVGEILNKLPAGTDARMMRVPEMIEMDLLEALRNTPFRVMSPEGEMIACRQIPETPLNIRVECHLMTRGLRLTAHMPEGIRPLTRGCEYAISAAGVSVVPEEQRALFRFLNEKQTDGRVMMDYSLNDTEVAVGEVLPYLKRRCAVEMSAELRAMLVRRPLETRVYLDRDGMSVTGKVIFAYGETELNPFSIDREKITLQKGEKLLLRDAEGEHAVLDILESAGFRVSKDVIRLREPDALYRFFSEGVRALGQVSQVFLSRDFRRMYNRRPGLRGTLKMEKGTLLAGLEIDGEPTDEILGVLEALRESRQYYRLKDGTILNLADLEEWKEPAESMVEAARRDGAQVDRDALVLKAYRVGYLTRLLAAEGVALDADDEVIRAEKELNGEIRPEKAPDTGLPLRDYQERGYEWMYGLDRMKMGGVLADDMGLGKTVQVIALLKSTADAKRTSLIVAPTSLTYNWLSEIRRFAPEMSAQVIAGTVAQREKMWEHVTAHGDVDVVITSYPLIRRDIDQIDQFDFRFVILDEAQNIKNAGSMAAAAVKRLRADSRFALTGTPMENGVGELWSIFDFVLPGYLPAYSAFLRRYQDGLNSEDLRRRIRPFLTRRLKQDVLSELPDKIETRLTAAMTAEQHAVYQAAMERLRPKVSRVLDEKGVNGSRMEILAAITELREVCCDPRLVMDGYDGGSGKEDMLLEMLPNLISAGRRVLVFSQFTSMLKLLRPKIENLGLKVMYLDGDTPAGERLTLTEEFNQGGADVFLISLRAGGSGLNLTGADVVVHYDPWWNPATEDQATDRAHRIGQMKKVDVFRLVTADSIEEKVVELGERKKALFDRLITPGETGLSALSEKDIRELFM